jgi:exopolysaccharide production protein ExoQ
VTSRALTRQSGREFPTVRPPARIRGRSPASGRNWFAVCALAMLVATDYKFRVRADSAAVGGTADSAIYIEVLVYSAVAAYLILLHGRPPRVNRVALPLFVLGAYVAVEGTSILETPYAPLAIVRFVEMLVVFLLVAAVVADGTREHLHRFAHGFILLVAGSVIFGVLFPMPRFALQKDRFTWLRIHPVTAGVYVAIATIICVVYLFAERGPRPGPRWSPFVYAVLLVLNGGGLIGTKTRGAVVGATVGLAVIILLRRRGRARLQLISAVVLLVGATLLASLGAIVSYFVRGETVASLTTLNSRTSLWALAWTAIQQKPMYGWGLEASRGIFLDSTGLGGGHNAIVNVAVDLGAVGVTVWLGLLVVVLTTLLRCRSQVDGIATDRAMLVAIVALLIADSLFFEGLGATSNIASISLFIIVGWSVVLSRADANATRQLRSAR